MKKLHAKLSIIFAILLIFQIISPSAFAETSTEKPLTLYENGVKVEDYDTFTEARDKIYSYMNNDFEHQKDFKFVIEVNKDIEMKEWVQFGSPFGDLTIKSKDSANPKTIKGTDPSIRNLFSVVKGARVKFKDIVLDGGGQVGLIRAESGGRAVPSWNIPAELNLENVILENGKASRGGAIYAQYLVKLIISNSTIKNNNADYGGAICTLIDQYSLLIKDSKIYGNSGKTGGALYIQNDGVLDGVNIYDNKAISNAGAIFTDRGKIDIVNSTIERNISENNAGGIYSYDGSLNIASSVKIALNKAKIGGGIFTRGELILNVAEGAYIANNIASSKGSDIAYYGSSISLGNAKDMNAKLTTDNSNKDIDGWYNDENGWNPYSAKEVDVTNIVPNAFLKAAYKDSLKATYKFISSNSEYALPKEVSDLLPTDDNKYNNGDVVDAKQPAKTTVSVDNGTWNFKGYDEKSKTIKDASVEFIGTWEFVPNQNINISVSKKWSDNSTDKEVTIKLLKKKPTVAINTDVEDWEEEVIDIGMRSMPDVAGTLSTPDGETETDGTTKENIPEGYEFVKGEDGQPITLTLNNENSYSGVFENLPKYEKDGKTLAEYKVYEVKVGGYTTSISGDQEKGFVVTNTKMEEPTPIPELFEVTFINHGKEYAKVKVEKDNSINKDSLKNESMPNNPSKEGYRFKEWNTKEDGSGISFTGEAIVNENMTVYAIYEKLEVPKPKPDKPNTPKENELPKTGDGKNILSYVLLLGLSGSLLLGFAVRKKKINN